MKKIIVAALLIAAMTTGARAQSVDGFIKKFDTFVTQVLDTPDSVLSTNIKSTNATFDSYIEQYDKTYREKMNNDQLQQFGKLRGKYRQKVVSVKAQRNFSSMKGWVKGVSEEIKESSNKKTTSDK